MRNQRPRYPNLPGANTLLMATVNWPQKPRIRKIITPTHTLRNKQNLMDWIRGVVAAEVDGVGKNKIHIQTTAN